MQSIKNSTVTVLGHAGKSAKARATTEILEPELVDVDAGLPLASPELDG